MRKVSSRQEFLTVINVHLPLIARAVEIGVLYGDFSNEILRIINPQELTLVDPYQIGEKKYGDENSLPTAYSTEDNYQDLVKRFTPELISGKVRVVRKLSTDAVKDYPNNHFDFIYIDGSHTYEDVKRDLRDWWGKLSEGGVLAGHDYIEAPDFGVIDAVDEFLDTHYFRMILFNENGGDWALKKMY